MTMLQDEGGGLAQSTTCGHTQCAGPSHNSAWSQSQPHMNGDGTVDLEDDTMALTQSDDTGHDIGQSQITTDIVPDYCNKDPYLPDQLLQGGEEESRNVNLQSVHVDQDEPELLYRPAAKYSRLDRATKTPVPGELESWMVSTLWPPRDEVAEDLEMPADLMPVERAPLHIQIQAYMRRWAIWASEVKDETARRDLLTAISNRIHDSWIYAIDQGYYPKFKNGPDAEEDGDKNEDKVKKGRKRPRNPLIQPADFASNGKDPYAITNGELSAAGVTMEMVNARVQARDFDRGEILLDELLTRIDRDAIEISDWSTTRNIPSVRNRNLLVYCLYVVQESRKDIRKLERLREHFKKGVQIRNTNDRIDNCRERVNQHLALAVELDSRKSNETGKEDPGNTAEDCMTVSSESSHEIDSDSNASIPHDDGETILDLARSLLSASNYDEVVKVFASRQITHQDLDTDGLHAATPSLIHLRTEIGRVSREIQRIRMLKQKQRRSEEPREALKIGHELKLSSQKLLQSREILRGLLNDASGQLAQDSAGGSIHSPGTSSVRPQYTKTSDTVPATPSSTVLVTETLQLDPNNTKSLRRPLVLDVRPPQRISPLEKSQFPHRGGTDPMRLALDLNQPALSNLTPFAAVSSLRESDSSTASDINPQSGVAAPPAATTATTQYTLGPTESFPSLHGQGPVHAALVADLGHQVSIQPMAQATSTLDSAPYAATDTQALKRIYVNQVWLPWLRNQHAKRQQQGQRLTPLPESLDGWGSIKTCLTDMGANPTQRNLALEIFTQKWPAWIESYSNRPAGPAHPSSKAATSPQIQHFFPSDLEVNQAIPPEGIMAADLIKMFSSRIADRSNEFGEAIRRIAVYNPHTHMVHRRDMAPVVPWQQTVEQQPMALPVSLPRNPEQILVQTSDDQPSPQVGSVGFHEPISQTLPQQPFTDPTVTQQTLLMSQPQFVNPAQLMYNPSPPLPAPISPFQLPTVPSTHLSPCDTTHQYTSSNSPTSTRPILRLKFPNLSKQKSNSDIISPRASRSQNTEIDNLATPSYRQRNENEAGDEGEGYSSHEINETRGFAFRYLPTLTTETQRQQVEEQIETYVKSLRTKKQRAQAAGTYITFGNGAHGVWKTIDGETPAGTEWFFRGEDRPAHLPGEQVQQGQKRVNEERSRDSMKIKVKPLDWHGRDNIVMSSGGGSERPGKRGRKRRLESTTDTTTSSSGREQRGKGESKKRRRVVYDGEEGDEEYFPDSKL